MFAHTKALSTLATIVAEFGDNLSPFLATVAEFCDRTVAEFALSTLATIVAEFGDNLSPVLATVAQFGDYSRQCGQGLTTDNSRERADEVYMLCEQKSLQLATEARHSVSEWSHSDAGKELLMQSRV